jgi:hypothetical protein
MLRGFGSDSKRLEASGLGWSAAQARGLGGGRELGLVKLGAPGAT